MSAGRGAVCWLLVIALCGCSGGWRPGLRTAASDATAAGALAEADRTALAGRPREAASQYEAIVRNYPKDPAAAEAMHRLVVMRLDPGSPLHDKRAGQALLRRLASDHGGTLAGHEARAWRAVLRDLDRCETESARTEADNEKLRQTLESIKDSDLELEQHQ